MSNIVQYVVVRGDLKKVLKWSTGALIAQACHATAAITHLYSDDEVTQLYLKDLDNMHKVVLEVSKVFQKIHHSLKLVMYHLQISIRYL